MSRDEHIENEIRRTLEQFDHPDRLPPNPFFFTRVEARLAAEYKKHRIYSLIGRPALITVLLALNLGMALWYFSGSEGLSPTDSHQQSIEILAGELNWQ